MNITNLFKKTGLDMPDYIKHQFKRFLFSYTRTSVAAFVLFVALCGQIFATEAITNGSFSSGSSGWTLSGDFWAGTNLSNYHTSPGYAAGGVDGAGTAKNSANGSMSQQVTIPSGATSVTLTYWYSITTQEIGGSAYDILSVVVNNANIVDTLSNVNNTSGSYQQRSAINLSSYAGQTITLKFAATTDVSNTTVFRIDDVSLTYTPLSVPTAPSNFQASVNDLHVTFSWTNNSPSDQYDVHAITDSSYIGIFSPNITTATTDLYSYGTSHCYTVMAHNAAGWSSESNQVCITPMSQPSLSSPSYGYQYPSGTPSANLSWNSVPGAVSYAINVSLYNTTGSYGVLASPYISNQGASGTSATISVSNGQTYYWQVIAYNDSPGASHWSSVYSFSVASPIPVTPTLSSPANGYSYPTGTTATTVYWNSSLNSTSYDVQVGGSCGDNSVYFGNTTNLNQAISGLSSGQTYNWQVRGNNNGTVSNFSGCYSFTIAPPIPGFASPANGYSYPSGTTSATLSWNSATGATSYDLQVGGSCGSSSLYSGNTSNLNRTVSGLTDGQTYYWRMQANNSAGASGYSSCRSFSVNTPPTITTITPNSGLNNASLNITNLAGTNFVSGATVKLTKSGQSDITATN
ncbi:MAG: hypothetical protein NTX59_10085, partial [Elusimicrobia bacterium]|nr:hypothetical protein [Elusimicrobiota bacterium]